MPVARARLTPGTPAITDPSEARRSHDHAFSTWTPAVTQGAVDIAATSVAWPAPNTRSVVNGYGTSLNRGAGHRIPTGKVGHREVLIVVERPGIGRPSAGMSGKSRCSPAQSRGSFRASPCLSNSTSSYTPRPNRTNLRVSVQRVDRERAFRYILAEELQVPHLSPGANTTVKLRRVSFGPEATDGMRSERRLPPRDWVRSRRSLLAWDSRTLWLKRASVPPYALPVAVSRVNMAKAMDRASK